jgi:heptosyltransferase I
MRILIVKLSAVGDVVHALPVLNALRTQLPDAYIGWAVHPGAANLLEGHPQLDELIVLPRRLPQYGGLTGFRNIVGSLKGKRGGWDAGIDLQGLTKSAIVTRLSGAKKRIGFAGKPSRELNGLFMNRRIQPQSDSVIQMNMELLSGLDLIPDTPPEAVLHTTADDDSRIDDWARTAAVAGIRFVVLDAFAGWSSKLWPDESWIETAGLLHQQHGLRPLLFHGPGERDHAEALGARMPATVGAAVAPDTTLRQYISLLRKHARLVIAADTGPMHIAAALGIPTVALFGPSDSRRNAPTFSNARYRALQDFTQPCSGTFTRLCKFHKPGDCMVTLRPDHVADAVQQLFAEV